MTYPIVIIITIGLYKEPFADTYYKDGTKAAPSCLPDGVWHMVNIYQFWALIEIVSFFSNFVGIIIALSFISILRPALKRTLIVPLALV